MSFVELLSKLAVSSERYVGIKLFGRKMGSKILYIFLGASPHRFCNNIENSFLGAVLFSSGIHSTNNGTGFVISSTEIRRL